MVAIDNVVAFDIVIQDAAPSRQSFGTIAILAYHEVSEDRLVYDTTPDGLAAMLVDGFTTSHPAYRKVAAIAAQSPKVPRVKLFNRAAPNAQTITLTPTNTTEGVVYAFSLNGVDIEYTVQEEDTVALIVDELVTLLDAVPNVSAADSNTHVTLTLTDDTGERMYLEGWPSYLTVKDTSADAGIASDLSAALLEDSDFYGVLIDSNSEAEINAAAAWCQTNKRILHALTYDDDVLGNGSTDVGSDLKSAGYAYAKAWYHADPSEQLDAAIMGRQFSRNPGSTTWENQRLSGITPDDLTPTQLTNAEAKNVGFYLRFGADTGATFNTVGASGRFLDITRDSDWLAANAQIDIFTHLLNQEKVPFTQAGIDGIEGVMRARFTIAEANGVLDAGWAITLPSLSEVDPADKAARRLVGNDAFSGRFQGAIHGVDVSGVLAI